jgi:hypothetical protein
MYAPLAQSGGGWREKLLCSDLVAFLVNKLCNFVNGGDEGCHFSFIYHTRRGARFCLVTAAQTNRRHVHGHRESTEHK